MKNTEEKVDLKNAARINLGSGRDLIEDYLNIDISDMVGADLVLDIENGLPMIKDSSVDDMVINNVLCQLSSPKVFVKVMNEIHRVLKPDAVAHIRVPNANHQCAFQDVFDTIRFTMESFTYMQDGHERFEKYGIHYGYKPFKVTMVENNSRQMKFDLTPVKNETK